MEDDSHKDEQAQVEDSQGDLPQQVVPKKYNKRQRQGENWLRLLMRTPQFSQCVQRLFNGATAKATAKWLIQQPDRGAAQHLSYETLRKYMGYLALCVGETAEEFQRISDRTSRRLQREQQKLKQKEINRINILQNLEAQTIAKGIATASPCAPEMESATAGGDQREAKPGPSAAPQFPGARSLPETNAIVNSDPVLFLDPQREIRKILQAQAQRARLDATIELNASRLIRPLAFESKSGIPLSEVTKIVATMTRTQLRLVELDYAAARNRAGNNSGSTPDDTEPNPPSPEDLAWLENARKLPKEELAEVCKLAREAWEKRKAG